MFAAPIGRGRARPQGQPLARVSTFSRSRSAGPTAPARSDAMQQFLGHEENPLRPDEWTRLTETVIEVARRSLVGRRFIDLYGPLGAGVQTVAYEEFSGVAPGAVDIVGEAEAPPVFS